MTTLAKRETYRAKTIMPMAAAKAWMTTTRLPLGPLRPCPASELKRQPKGPREGFLLDLSKTFGEKVHTLTPVPYVFKPLEKIAVGHAS